MLRIYRHLLTLVLPTSGVQESLALDSYNLLQAQKLQLWQIPMDDIRMGMCTATCDGQPSIPVSGQSDCWGTYIWSCRNGTDGIASK